MTDAALYGWRESNTDELFGGAAVNHSAALGQRRLRDAQRITHAKYLTAGIEHLDEQVSR